MANLQKIYSDIDFTFTRKPVTNDVALSYDVQAVTRSIRNIIRTRNYEKPFNPDFGSKIDFLLFELMSTSIASQMETEIKDLIVNYEPRAIVNNVEVIPEYEKNQYYVSISFYLQNATLPTTLTLILERTR